jgi:hypothetical protein
MKKNQNAAKQGASDVEDGGGGGGGDWSSVANNRGEKKTRIEKKRSLQVQVQGVANYEAIIERERKRGRGERRRCLEN